MPIVRRAEVVLPFPADAPRKAVTVALLTDTHLSGPDNSPARLARIVRQINGLKPDLILLGGDYIGDDKGGAIYDARTSIAPFAGLRAPLGVVAVLGNHDSRSKLNRRALNERDWQAAFAKLGITLLQDRAVRRGPLAIGGLQDIYTRKPDMPGTLAAMARVGGAPVILSHGPDVFPKLPDARSLTVVGHTHCGQIAFPFVGITYVPSKYGTRYACGVYREGARTMIVSGGVGTSSAPARMLAPPDIWLVTIRPG
ncbi:metallophosphoesterase [Sphingobium limneticum]|uniref:metallophosphoesterase n=2 Tax=Sphingomonadaceae TaxID=41297 RepID=UPI000E76252A|nr:MULTISPECIES: metallophosphoesterase [Sphingobium]KAA9013460.1 metallophosphoesterase [Sphingobium limneticum]MBU0932155.1 metallophosphoesterase [Alphaproteobacteria bacterium]